MYMDELVVIASGKGLDPFSYKNKADLVEALTRLLG